MKIDMKISMNVKTYRTCNSTLGFSKYKFYNNLLGSAILLKVTLCIT